MPLLRRAYWVQEAMRLSSVFLQMHVVRAVVDVEDLAPVLCQWFLDNPAAPAVLKPHGASCIDGNGGDADCAVGLYCKAQICSTTP
jgi:hypothetical protein